MLWELSQLCNAGASMDCRATHNVPGQRHIMSILLAMEYLGVGACAVLVETAE